MNHTSTGVRVLFTGQYWPGANSLYIARAFQRCGAVIRILNDTALWPDWTGKGGRIARRLLLSLVEAEWNNQLLSLVDTFAPDLVYITNADFCWPATLESIHHKSIPVMCFYHDVQWKNRPGSRFSQNISHFDLIATTRYWHKPEFMSAGARQVVVVRFGYEPTVHRPVTINQFASERYGAEVTFIGTMESHRSAELTSLVMNDFPYHFRLWGGLWEQLPADSPLHRYWQGRAVYEQEIPIIYAASKIALHWVGWEPGGKDSMLQKGDQHNSRTFQIAACGGAMMLAQRTEEHLQFFHEDLEAVYFSDVEELRDKLGYWLEPTREAAREKVSSAALARCQAEDYSYVPVVRQLLAHFGLPTVNSK